MKLRLQITKESGIRFISHLEYQRSIEKAIRRAGIPVAYSEGFNPHMKFSLASALSVGVTSSCEFAEIRLAEERPLSELVKALAAALPMGIHIVRADLAEDKAPKLMAQAQGASYEVHVPCASDPASQLAAFAAVPEVPYTKAHKKGKGRPKTIDVKSFIPQVEAQWQDGSLELRFDIRITPTGSMKASEFLQVLEQDFQVPLAFSQADIRRVDLYSRDGEGRKIPLIGEA